MSGLEELIIERNRMLEHRPCNHDWTDWAHDARAAARSGVGAAESRECRNCGRKEVD